MNVIRYAVRVCLILLVATSGSQTLSKPDTTLKALASMQRSTVCLSEKMLHLDVAFINVSGSTYRFDSKHISIRPAYGALVDTSTMKRRMAGLAVQQDRMGAPQSPRFVVLKENETYVQHVSLPLTDTFFNTPGFYVVMPSISLDGFSVAPAPRTGIIFEIRDCD